MAEDKREILTRMFPDYDIDTLLASFTNATAEQIADWCLNNHDRVPMKRKGEKRKHSDPAPSPSGEQDSESDLDFDDIADGLLLDRLVKELLNKLKKEMSLQNNKSEGTAADAKYILSAVYPKLRVDFLKIAYQESGFRLCTALIIGFFVSNKLTQRLRDVMPNPESNMWVMTDSLATTRKKYTLDIFNADISHFGENITTPVTTFVTMMNALTKKYPLIVNRLQLLPDAFQLRLDVPDDIEKFECGVCFSEYTITRRIMCGAGPSASAEDERHSFCRDCVKHQAQAATEEMPLAEGSVGLKCMAYECKHPILYSAVRNLIPKNVRRKIDERIMEENIGNSGLNLERCRECNFAIEMEESKEENKVFACPNCEKNWCRLCEREWDGDHFGISCAELDDKKKVDKKQRELERRLNEAVIRKCKCGLQFTKSDGCNKMTCRCGKTQCYLCRKEGINYTHFCQHVRNPGVQQCHQCDKTCTLWADANQLDQQIINQIRAENGEGVNPDVPGPSRPRAQRQPSPPHAYNPINFLPHQRPPGLMGFGMPFPQPVPLAPMPPPHQYNAMPDALHFGFNNGPQGFNVNVNFQQPYHGLRLGEGAQLRNPREIEPQIAPRRQVDEAIERAIDDERNRRAHHIPAPRLIPQEPLIRVDPRRERANLREMEPRIAHRQRAVVERAVENERHRHVHDIPPRRPEPIVRVEPRRENHPHRERVLPREIEQLVAQLRQADEDMHRTIDERNRHVHDTQPRRPDPICRVDPRRERRNTDDEIEQLIAQQRQADEAIERDLEFIRNRRVQFRRLPEPEPRIRAVPRREREPEPLIRADPRREREPEPLIRVDPRRERAQDYIDLHPAQNYGPIGGNANMNNELPRIMNINIGQNNMVQINPNPVEIFGPIQEPIIGYPLNAQNNMEQPVFEEADFEYLAQFSDDDDDDIEEIDDDDDGSLSDDDEINMDHGFNEPIIQPPLQEEQPNELLDQAFIGINEPVIKPPLQEEQPNEILDQAFIGNNEPVIQPPPQVQQPNELIDLTEMEDDAPIVETDMKHIERIHDKGERYEVMPIDLDSHVREVRQLDKDWTYVYQLIDELKTSNQKMRESMTINDMGREPDKSQAILGTLDLHDEIANFIIQKMPQLNAQTEKMNNL